MVTPDPPNSPVATALPCLTTSPGRSESGLVDGCSPPRSVNSLLHMSDCRSISFRNSTSETHTIVILGIKCMLRPPLCMSITESQVGNRSFDRKNASFSATVPSTFPGNTRLKFCPFGQSLVPAADARVDNTGMIKTSPFTSATSKRRARSRDAICPSYSSP